MRKTEERIVCVIHKLEVQENLEIYIWCKRTNLDRTHPNSLQEGTQVCNALLVTETTN